MITGKTLIGWGYKPGPWFAKAVAAAERARRAGADEVAIRVIVERLAPPPGPPTVGLRRAGELSYRLNVRAEDELEAQNIASVERHMRELMRVPTLVAGLRHARRLPLRLGARHRSGWRHRCGQGRHSPGHAFG
jgi:tRNA-splicing ligase RtcB (3'-phosphate/5'-hydroxy nucleic acid ligase)